MFEVQVLDGGEVRFLAGEVVVKEDGSARNGIGRRERARE